MGRHGIPAGPWLSRPRKPFRVDGFTLRFVIIPLGGAALAVVLGLLALADGRVSGVLPLVVGLLLVALAAAYLRRPVQE